MVKWRYIHFPYGKMEVYNFPYLNIGVLKRLFSGGLRRIMEARKKSKKNKWRLKEVVKE